MYPRIRALLAVGTVAVAACSDSRGIAPELTGPRADLVAGTGAAALTATNSLTVGQRLTLKASNSRSRLKWTSSDSRVVSVSSSGTATANAVGTATVRATGTGVYDTWYLTVNPVAVATVTSFSTAPASVTLLPGASQQFSSTATWSDGGFYPFSVTYSAQGGTISSTGLFTAGSTAGRYMVIAACLCGLSDTSYVTVPSLTLTIAPKSVSLTAGQTQQFSASALWSSGATALPPLTWTTTGGSITSNGAYTAPATAGTYKVYVSHTGGTAKDSAVVTVGSGTQTAAPPTAPTSPTSPTGTEFFSDGFENGTKTNANGFRWTDATYVTVSNERAYSGSYALRFEFGAAGAGEDSWSEQRFDMGRYLSDVTVEYMLYVPSNFKHRRDDGIMNNKFIMLWRDTYSDVTGGTWRVGWEYLRTDDYTSYGRFLSSRWDLNMLTDWGTWGTPEPNVTPPLLGANGPMMIGQWNRVKMHVRAASSRTAEDGIIEMYVNGTPVLTFYKARFHNAYSTPADAVLRNGYLLGWANSGFDSTTVFYIDDVKFSTGG